MSPKEILINKIFLAVREFRQETGVDPVRFRVIYTEHVDHTSLPMKNKELFTIEMEAE